MIKICAWCNKLEGFTLKGRGITDVMCLTCKDHYWALAQGLKSKRVILSSERPLIILGSIISKTPRLIRRAVFDLKLARAHYLNQLHLMCRAMDLGFSRDRAIKISKVLTYKIC